MTLKKTVLFEQHLEAGAKMVPFAGFEMPLQYRSVLEEHRAVRQAAGLFDVSHMGEVEVSGPDVLEFVQRITTNDVSKLTEGKVQYSAMCNEDGGILDDLLVYHLGDRYMLVVNAGNIADDVAWMRKHQPAKITINDMSDATALLALQGPASLSILRQVTDRDLTPLAYYHSVRASVAGVDLLLSRTGYTGELGFELYFPAKKGTAKHLWQALLDAGSTSGLIPVGLGARDTLRLEMGFCLYGNDIDRSTNPIEAGLGWITKLAKGAFIGSDAIAQVKRSGPSRRLVGISSDNKAVPRKGYPIMAAGKQVGAVTSGSFSPTLEHGIAMGYIPNELAASGGGIGVSIRGNTVPVEVVSLPFLKKS